MNKYKLVIFDLDGTIADTSLGVTNCVRYTEKVMGLPQLDDKILYSFVGPPMEESYAKYFGLKGDDVVRAVKLHKEYAISKGYKELELYTGLVELLDKLRANKINTAVATLKAQTTTEKIFEYLGINSKFDYVIGTNIANPMTKKQLIEKCIERFGGDKNSVVLIGDSKYDAIGAQEASVDFIAVTYGFGFKSEEDAKSYSPIAICTTICDISKILYH